MAEYVVGINGGKKDGRTSGYLKNCLKEAEKLGAETKLIDLSDFSIPSLSKSTSNPELDTPDKVKSEDVNIIIADVRKADGIVFATPVHWFAPSSEMKLFIDHLTPLENAGFLLEGKVAGFIVYGNEGGRMSTLMELSAVANHMGMVLPPYSMIYLGGQKNNWAEKDVILLAHNMIKLIRAIKNGKIKFDYDCQSAL